MVELFHICLKDIVRHDLKQFGLTDNVIQNTVIMKKWSEEKLEMYKAYSRSMLLYQDTGRNEHLYFCDFFKKKFDEEI